MYSSDEKEIKMLQLIIQDIEASPKFSALGFFTVDRTTLTAMLGTILTYFIILFQTISCNKNWVSKIDKNISLWFIDINFILCWESLIIIMRFYFTNFRNIMALEYCILKSLSLMERLGFYTILGSILTPLVGLILQTLPIMYSYLSGELKSKLMVPSGKKFIEKKLRT